MQRQKILNTSSIDETQSSASLTISLDSLANQPEKLVEVKNRHIHLKGEYNHLRECNCFRFYNRTDNKLDQLQKIKVPCAFKTPLDFFESVTAAYIAKQLYLLPEIHIVSFGSGSLLRESIIIAKLIKELEKIYLNTKKPAIFLHAVDPIYKIPQQVSNDAWLKSNSYLCQQEFKKLIQQFNLDVALLTYSSIGEYNKNNTSIYPSVILSIDAPFRFDVDFPEYNPVVSYTNKEYTQEGMLVDTKKLAKNSSLYATLTHIETNKGMFIIVEKKESEQWKKEWIHTIASSKKPDLHPSVEIQSILAEKEKQFLLSDAGRFEVKQIERFKTAPLSRAMKEHDEDTIQALLQLNDKTIVNAHSTDGFTALHWAAMRRDDTHIPLLVAHGADPNIKNIYGRTPLDYYEHQVCPGDFKDFVSPEFYQKLCENEKDSAPNMEVMPEFYELYHHEDDIKSVFGWTRNGSRSNLSIFNPAVPKKSEALHQSPQEKKSVIAERKVEEVNVSTINTKRMSTDSSLKNDKTIRKNNPALLFTSTHSEKQKHSENILLTENLSLSFKNAGDLGISLSIMVNGVKKNGMFISEINKQKIISCHHNPVSLISLLKNWGETARNIAALIEQHLLLIKNNKQQIKSF